MTETAMARTGGCATCGTGRTRAARRAPLWEARRVAAATLPALPLLFFLLAFLAVPMGFVVATAVSDPEIADALPDTAAALRDWSGHGAPPATAYAGLGRELAAAQKANRLRPLARRVGYEFDRGAVLVMSGARAALDSAGPDPEAWRARLTKADPRWRQPGVWQVVKARGSRYGLFYLGWAMGFRTVLDADGQPLGGVADYDFRTIYLRTVAISLAVTALTVLIGYPVAYVAAHARGRAAAVLMFFILLPFWTSLLVRTMSWIVVLQTNGVANQLLEALGVIAAPLTLLHTRGATVAAMVQIQLPFTVLPMISIMRTIPPAQVRAARSLGAGPLRAHGTVYLPQVVPGIAAGALLTFVLCLGFYITPALLGGPADQMVSFFVARFINEELNWGLASALSLVLVVGAGLVALPMARFVTRHMAHRP